MATKRGILSLFVVSCSLSSLEQRCISSHSTPVGQSCSERYHLQDSWLQNLSSCLKVECIPHNWMRTKRGHTNVWTSQNSAVWIYCNGITFDLSPVFKASLQWATTLPLPAPFHVFESKNRGQERSKFHAHVQAATLQGTTSCTCDATMHLGHEVFSDFVFILFDLPSNDHIQSNQ